MDAHGFARLSKQVAQAPTRRRMLGVLGAGVGAAVLGRQMATAADVEDEAFGFCRIPGDTCGDDTQCCSHNCRNGVCTCLKRGKSVFAAVICCSGKKKKGKCK